MGSTDVMRGIAIYDSDLICSTYCAEPISGREWVQRVTGCFDTQLGQSPSYSASREVCAYCGRSKVIGADNCDGCGAPLNVRIVKPL